MKQSYKSTETRSNIEPMDFQKECVPTIRLFQMDILALMEVNTKLGGIPLQMEESRVKPGLHQPGTEPQKYELTPKGI